MQIGLTVTTTADRREFCDCPYLKAVIINGGTTINEGAFLCGNIVTREKKSDKNDHNYPISEVKIKSEDLVNAVTDENGYFVVFSLEDGYFQFVADIVDLKETVDEGQIDEFLTGEFVKISFKMEIGDLVDSEIMQLYPIPFAKEMCQGVTKNMELDSESITEDSKPISGNNAAASQTNTSSAQQPNMGAMNMGQSGQQPMMGQPMMGQPQVMGQQVNVQPAQFSAFGAMPNGMYQPENIDLIMDVPLEVTVELGRTHKKISEILDFGPGKIIELNKIAGEPIDVLVNGKYVAKGEVVVIEESFGVRITEIVNVPKPKQD